MTGVSAVAKSSEPRLAWCADEVAAGDVREFLQVLQPPLIWQEPAPGPTRLSAFAGLIRGPLTSGGCGLVEGRAFFEDGAVHAVVSGDRVRWVAYWEPSDGTVAFPAWLPATLHHAAEPDTLPVVVQKRKIDIARPPSGWHGREMTLVEYLCGDGVVQWRIEPKPAAERVN